MIEERGKVVAIEPGGRIRVAVNRQSSCGSCSARAACGQGLLQTLRPGRSHEVSAVSRLPVRVGDTVVLGVVESLLVRGAVLVYLLPLLALLTGALLAEWLGLPETGSIAFGAAGFGLAVLWLYFFNRKLAGSEELLPEVLRIEAHAAMNERIRWQV